MTRLEILIIGKAIRDTMLAPTGRANLVREIIRTMTQHDPTFKYQVLQDIVSNADYKDRLVDYKLKDIK